MGQGGAIGPHQAHGARGRIHHHAHVAVERQPLLSEGAAARHALHRGVGRDQGGQGGELPARAGGIGVDLHRAGLQLQGAGRMEAAGPTHHQGIRGGDGERAVAGQLTRHRDITLHREVGGGGGRRVEVEEATQGEPS